MVTLLLWPGVAGRAVGVLPIVAPLDIRAPVPGLAPSACNRKGKSLGGWAALFELRSEQVPLTLSELSDRLDLADPVARKESAALGAAPMPLACQ